MPEQEKEPQTEPEAAGEATINESTVESAAAENEAATSIAAEEETAAAAAESDAGPNTEEVIAALEAELTEVKAAAAAQTDQLQRLAAEFQNSKRRQEKQLGDAIDRESARPDFAVLMYPVITMKEDFMHRGSRDNLLGENPAPALVERFSPELCVGENTPPALLIHAGDDRAVPVENSLVFYQALIRKGIAAEMHLYPVGGHGFGLAPDFRGQTVGAWPQRCVEWLKMQDR